MTNNFKRIFTTVAASVGAMAALARPAYAQVEINPPTGFFEDFGALITGVLDFVIIIAALLVFIYLIWGGIEWITSGGDKGKTEDARNKITSAIIGLIILAASWAILTVVLNFLGYTNLQDVFNQNLPAAN